LAFVVPPMTLAFVVAPIAFLAGMWNIFLATMYLVRGWKWPPLIPFPSRARGRARAFILILASAGFAMTAPLDFALPKEIRVSLADLSWAAFALYVVLAFRKPRSTSHQPDSNGQPSRREKKRSFWDDYN
jgi:hypothetical protein